MLHKLVGRIFLKDDKARAAFSVGLKRFLVPDRGTTQMGLEVVLLLESPHTDEVEPENIRDRYPLAGNAGREVRDQLAVYGPRLGLPELPIGQLVHQKAEAVRRLGVMNVSQLPLQSGPYGTCPNLRCASGDRWCDYIRCMNHIRDRPHVKHYQGSGSSDTKRGHLKLEMNQLNDAITRDLRQRLRALRPSVLIVPCGNVAAAFYMKALIARLPHPTSRPNGERERGWRALDWEEKGHLRNIVGRLEATC